MPVTLTLALTTYMERKMINAIFDVETQTLEYIDLSADEIKQREELEITLENNAHQKALEIDNTIKAKKLLLEKLGITDDEAKLLFS